MAVELRERERRLAESESAAQQAQLNVLRLQLNPHFLFNTLNTLSGLIALDRKAAAEQVVLNLSQFLRYSLRSERDDLVPLAKELEVQSMYLDIEKARFGDRLEVNYSIEPGCEGALVPPFLLQPLVENAIKHVVALSEKDVTLTIAARRDGDELALTVENSAGDHASQGEEGLGIGLANVHRRLDALFGSRASLEARATAEQGWCNLIRMPLKNGAAR